MDKEGWKRLRGVKRLIHDGVERGANFVEKHHRHAAEKPFQILESITPIAAPTRVVHSVHNGVLWLAYGSIRSINQIAEMADDWVVNKLHLRPSSPSTSPPSRTTSVSLKSRPRDPGAVTAEACSPHHGR